MGSSRPHPHTSIFVQLEESIHYRWHHVPFDLFSHFSRDHSLPRSHSLPRGFIPPSEGECRSGLGSLTGPSQPCSSGVLATLSAGHVRISTAVCSGSQSDGIYLGYFQEEWHGKLLPRIHQRIISASAKRTGPHPPQEDHYRQLLGAIQAAFVAV